MNVFEYTDWLTMNGLAILVNSMEVGSLFNKSYNKEFQKPFAVGDTVRVPLPQRFLIRNGLGYDPQGINRQHTTITVQTPFGVDFEWDDAEAALKMERGEELVKKNYLEPAMAQIAQEIDSRCAQFAYLNANNIVGVLGTDPTTTLQNMQARQRMKELACPKAGDKGACIPSSVATSIQNGTAAYFNPSGIISAQYKSGSLGTNAGFEYYESQSLYTHTAGTWAGAVTVTSINAAGDQLTVVCTTGDTFNRGDVFTVDLVKQVNPSTRRVSPGGQLKNILVTQDTVGVGAAATLNIYPALLGPGSQYQNVDALPVAAAALTLFPGTVAPNGKSGAQGLFIHEDAFALVGIPLEKPKAVEISQQSRDPDTGIAIRFVRAWDPVESKMINRFDCMIGFGVLYGDNCCVRLQCA